MSFSMTVEADLTNANPAKVFLVPRKRECQGCRNKACGIGSEVECRVEECTAPPATETCHTIAPPGNWPLLSRSLGVRPSEIGKATKAWRDAGIPTDFAKDGQAVLRDPLHHVKVMDRAGQHDNDGTYHAGGGESNE